MARMSASISGSPAHLSVQSSERKRIMLAVALVSFASLLLELGLTRLEIEAVKARGVGQLLAQCEHALAEARPPELGAAAEKTRTAWEAVLACCRSLARSEWARHGDGRRDDGGCRYRTHEKVASIHRRLQL